MSTINKKPYIATLVNGLQSDAITELYKCVNGKQAIQDLKLGSPRFVAFKTANHGVNHVLLEVDNLRKVTGYLIWNGTTFVFISYNNNNPKLSQAEIDPVTFDVKVIKERLTIEELRRVLYDTFDVKEGGGLSLEEINEAIENNELPALDTALAQKASLSGANFTGSISAPEVLEIMTGYTFEKATITNITYEYIYAGATKTGNKLTFVLAMYATKEATVSGNKLLGTFKIPSTIGAKLYPTTIGTVSLLDFKTVVAVKSDNTFIDQKVIMDKQSNTALRVYLGNIDSFPANNKSYIRYEATFLLSDNLAQ